MKKCPFCAEEIQDEAIKCKHCGEFLNKPSQSVPSKIKYNVYKLDLVRGLLGDEKHLGEVFAHNEAEALYLALEKFKDYKTGDLKIKESGDNSPVINHSVKTTQPRVATCDKCNIQLMVKEEWVVVSLGGILGVFLFIIGLLVLIFNPIIGALLIIVGVFLGSVSRAKRTVLFCPQCGDKRPV